MTIPVKARRLGTDVVALGEFEAGDLVLVEHGGTGLGEVFVAGDILYATAADTLAARGIGAAGTVLRSDGALPQWSTLVASDLPANVAYTDVLGQTFTVEQKFSNAKIYADRTSPAGHVLAGKVVGDTVDRFLLTAEGVLAWGSGTATRDTNLYRSAADTLRTDDSLVVGAVLSVPTGDQGFPSYTFIGDTNTGMYSPTADQLAWTLGGAQTMLLTTTGLVKGAAALNLGTPAIRWTSIYGGLLDVTGTVTAGGIVTANGFTATGSGLGLNVNAGNVNSLMDFDFPGISTSVAQLRMLRDTNTTANTGFYVFRGDGTGTEMFSVTKNLGTTIVGNLGVGSAWVDHTATSLDQTQFRGPSATGLLIRSGTGQVGALSYADNDTTIDARILFAVAGSRISLQAGLTEVFGITPTGATVTGGLTVTSSLIVTGSSINFSNNAAVLTLGDPTAGTGNAQIRLARGGLNSSYIEWHRTSVVDARIGMDSNEDVHINNLFGGSIIFSTGGSERGRMNGGILTWGTTLTTGAAAGDIVIPQNRALRGANLAATGTLRLLRTDGADNVLIGDGAGVLSLGYDMTAANPVRIRVGSVSNLQITAGAADSGGAGFRQLLVPN